MFSFLFSLISARYFPEQNNDEVLAADRRIFLGGKTSGSFTQGTRFDSRTVVFKKGDARDLDKRERKGRTEMFYGLGSKKK